MIASRSRADAPLSFVEVRAPPTATAPPAWSASRAVAGLRWRRGADEPIRPATTIWRSTRVVELVHAPAASASSCRAPMSAAVFDVRADDRGRAAGDALGAAAGRAGVPPIVIDGLRLGTHVALDGTRARSPVRLTIRPPVSALSRWAWGSAGAGNASAPDASIVCDAALARRGPGGCDLADHRSVHRDVDRGPVGEAGVEDQQIRSGASQGRLGMRHPDTLIPQFPICIVGIRGQLDRSAVTAGRTTLASVASAAGVSGPRVCQASGTSSPAVANWATRRRRRRRFRRRRRCRSPGRTRGRRPRSGHDRSPPRVLPRRCRDRHRTARSPHPLLATGSRRARRAPWCVPLGDLASTLISTLEATVISSRSRPVLAAPTARRSRAQRT